MRTRTTTRSQFTKYDITDRPDIDWGTRKGSAYIYWSNGEIVFDGVDYHKTFKSLYALNKWLLSIEE